MKFIPNQCGFILEVSNGIYGFDILVNAIWAEIVSIIETRASVIFNPGNPDTFYKVLYVYGYYYCSLADVIVKECFWIKKLPKNLSF